MTTDVLLIFLIASLVMLVVGGVKVVLSGSSKRKNVSATKTLWYANFGFGFITIALLLLHFLHFLMP